MHWLPAIDSAAAAAGDHSLDPTCTRCQRQHKSALAKYRADDSAKYNLAIEIYAYPL